MGWREAIARKRIAYEKNGHFRTRHCSWYQLVKVRLYYLIIKKIKIKI